MLVVVTLLGALLPMAGLALGISYRIIRQQRAALQASEARCRRIAERSTDLTATLDIGSVFHDLNNLLTGIAGFAELGRHALPPTHPVCDDLDEIVKTTSRAANLTRRLLAVSRTHAATPCALDLNALITGMNRLLQQLLGTDITLTVQTTPNLGLVRADPGLLEQVLMNLVVNARDAMAGGGMLTIATAQVTLGAGTTIGQLDCPPGDYVRLAVGDTGTGMSADTQARLFEPFFTTKAPGHGTGLGLSICYRIVKQFSGGIQVTSAPGCGTTVAIYLPRIAAEVPYFNH